MKGERAVLRGMVKLQRPMGLRLVMLTAAAAAAAGRGASGVE